VKATKQERGGTLESLGSGGKKTYLLANAGSRKLGRMILFPLWGKGGQQEGEDGIHDYPRRKAPKLFFWGEMIIYGITGFAGLKKQERTNKKCHNHEWRGHIRRGGLVRSHEYHKGRGLLLEQKLNCEKLGGGGEFVLANSKLLDKDKLYV